MKIEQITCAGRPVRNLLHQNDQAQGIALLLPGAYYASQAPGLYYVREVLFRAGLDVLSIDYAYFVEGRGYSAETRPEALAEAEAALLHALEIARGSHMVIAGKSLGSVIALELALKHRLGQPTDLVLLTPVDQRLAVLANTHLAEAARSAGTDTVPPQPWRLFAARCGADDLRDDEAWQQVEPMAMRAQTIDLPLTTHGLDALDGYASSLEGLRQMCSALEDWLARRA